MPENPLRQLAKVPDKGRVFSTLKRARLQQMTHSGHVRLDAIARTISDVSEDDLLDLGRPNSQWWVARKVVLDVVDEASQAQELRCRTWAGGMARVGADRRVSLTGDSCRYEASTTWISIDPESGRPTPLPEWFATEYGDGCEGRRASVRLTHGGVLEGSDETIWPLRQVEFDHHGHVNNGAYWPVVEEMLHRYEFARSGRFRVEIEFRTGIPHADSVTLKVHNSATRLSIWWLVDDAVAASAIIRRAAEIGIE